MSTTENKVYIIGIGSDGLAGLTAREREILASSELILGSDQTLELVNDLPVERRAVGADLQEVVGILADRIGKQRLVLLVGGDPLFYGLARYLCDRLGKDHFEVLPHVSSMQLAFARIKESWEEAVFINLQSSPLHSALDRIRTANVAGLFTSEQEGPHEIARQLLDRGLDYFRAYICENLGAPDERVTQGDLPEIMEMDFSPLNIVILKRKPGRPDLPARRDSYRLFGNPDELFAQSQPKNGLITQAEVRALALSHLSIHPGSIVWDIGAGSGSVGIEAARLSDPGMVYAIEQDAADYHLILANAEMLGVRNLKAVHGIAPAIFADLPTPDGIFFGGVGREVARIIEAAWKSLRQGGHLVVNVAHLEYLATIHQLLKDLGGRVEVQLIQICRGVEQLEMLRFEAGNPSFLLTAAKSPPE